MLSWFYLGRVYQTIPHSLHYRRTTAQTDSLDLIKMINVTPNVNQPESSEANKRIKIRTSTSYSAQSQTQAPGRDQFRNKKQR